VCDEVREEVCDEVRDEVRDDQSFPNREIAKTMDSHAVRITGNANRNVLTVLYYCNLFQSLFINIKIIEVRPGQTRELQFCHS
jgi:hypothetical protein